jgi:RHS repeat-associated protein
MTNKQRIAMDRQMCLVVTLAAAIVLAPGAAAGNNEKPPKGTGKYIMVLRHSSDVSLNRNKPEPPKTIVEPEIAQLGGRILKRDGEMIILFLPLAKAKRLRADANIAYLQRVWMGETGDDLKEPEEEGAGSSRAVTTDSAESDLTWSSGAFDYDDSGNIKKIGTDAYAYDQVGRIATATVNGMTETYRYDSFGNLVEKTMGSNPPGLIPVDSGSNRLIGEIYDAAGNVLTNSRAKPATYVYDSMGLVVYASGQGLGATQGKRMIYTADDERLRVTTGVNSHRWMLRDLQGRVLREFTGSENWFWQKDYFYADGRLVAEEREEENGGRIHFHTDHLGSARMTTMENRMRLGRHDYLPFGQEQTSMIQEAVNFGQNADAMKFTSHERDYFGLSNVENVDYLDYMHARYYNPMMGRFLSVDPGKDWDPKQPQSWNMYAYVRNNPIGNADPTGKATTCSTQTCTTTADTYDPAHSTGQTTVATPDMQAAATASVDKVAVPPVGTHETLGYGVRDASGNLTVTMRVTGMGNTTGNSSGATVKDTVPSGAEFVIHGHIDGGPKRSNGMVDAPALNGGYGDTESLALRNPMPTATVSHGQVGWHEIQNGQLSFTAPVGALNGTQQRAIQYNLDRQQKLGPFWRR